MSTFLTCDGAWSTGPDGAIVCEGSAVAVDASHAMLLISGGFDADAAGVGFVGVITLFATGLGVGLIVQTIRRLRS